MHIKDGHKKLRKSKEKEKTMRRTRSMLAVLGIVCALSGITGCSNRNGNTSATSGSESNMQNGSNGTQAESTVCLKSPNLHLSETLSAELSFTTQRLLSNQRVWAGGTCILYPAGDPDREV